MITGCPCMSQASGQRLCPAPSEKNIRNCCTTRCSCCTQRQHFACAGCIFSASLGSFTVREKQAGMTSFPPFSLSLSLSPRLGFLEHHLDSLTLFFNRIHTGRDPDAWRQMSRHMETNEQTHRDRQTICTCRQDEDERMQVHISLASPVNKRLNKSRRILLIKHQCVCLFVKSNCSFITVQLHTWAFPYGNIQSVCAYALMLAAGEH